ncbi:MAG: acetyl-CoA acetyltransferase [Ilumatobacteraceae bacterium]|nr:acetyl-CoA acetyltransferase [Ilumatobacteraceae bacterium]
MSTITDPHDAVIVAAGRTAIGRSHRGSLVDVDAFALARVAIQGVLDRSGIDPLLLDDIVMAESLQGGGVIARHSAVELGLAHVPGLAVNRHCAAGLGALQIAASSIRAGMDRAVIAGGTESLSSMPQTLKAQPASGRDFQPWMSPSHTATADAPSFDMSITVGENTARLADVTREQADAWALQSHQRAARATASGAAAAEILPVTVATADGAISVFDTDEQPRLDTTLERLAGLKPLHPEIDGFTVTAGNAAGLNDAAAAVMIVSAEFAQSHGLLPLGRIVGWASVGVTPERTGLAPTLAIPEVLRRTSMTISDIDSWEINEAFCSVAVASTRILGLDPEHVNENGSGCGLGHPVAATGARMVVTMLNHLRRTGGTNGCVSMCAGGGMGSAMVVELL